MNLRHRRFAEEYSLDDNGAAAAVRAGYSEGRAKQTAHRLLGRSDVVALVQQLDADRREEIGVDAKQGFEPSSCVPMRCVADPGHAGANS